MQTQASETSRSFALSSIPARQRIALRGRGDDSIAHRGRSFLIVDDEDFSRSLIRAMLLESHPSRIDTARDGGEALALLQRDPQGYDCVITDIKMRPTGGLELLKAIRLGTGEIPRDLPVLLLTVDTQAKLLGTAMALDAQGFLAKPVSFATLHSRLNRILGEGRAIRPALAYSVVPAVTEKPAEAEIATAQPARGFALQADFSGDTRPDGAGIELALALVPAGSVLARDFRSRDGDLLLGAGNVLTERMLRRLRALNDLDSVIDSIWVVVPAAA
jgi:two-component system OmpR family response regulator